MYETFDHTADLGLRIRAPSLPELLAEAARALSSTIVENPQAVEPKRRVDIELPADQNEFMLFDWLNRILYHFDADHLLLAHFEVTVDERGLHGVAQGETIDLARHILNHEVKAITYHGLNVSAQDDGWQAEVILDI